MSLNNIPTKDMSYEEIMEGLKFFRETPPATIGFGGQEARDIIYDESKVRDSETPTTPET